MQDTASFIADRGLELARMARAHDLDALAHFLDMAVREANLRARDGEPDEPIS